MNLVNHSLHHSRGMGFYCLLRRGLRDIVFGLLFLIILTGCSSSKSPIISGINQTDLTDSLPIIALESFRDAFTATGILGAYDLVINPDTKSGELIPKRTSMIGESFIVSGTSFFTITPCQDCLKLKNLDYDDPYIKATFYASHPFEKGNLSEPPSPKNRLDLDIFDLALVVFPLEDEPTEPHLIDIDIYSESCGYPDGYTRELSEVIGNEFACPYFLVVDNSDTGIATFNRFEMGTKDHTFDAWFAGGRFELYLTFGYGASTTFENRLAPTYFNPEFNRKAPWKVNVIPPAQGWPPYDETETRDVIVEVYDWQIGATVDPNLDDPSDIYSQSDIVGVGVEINMMTNELQIVTAPTGSHTGMPDDPLIFTVPIANENFLPGGYYQGYVKVLDSRVPPQAPFDGQTDSIIDVPDGVTLDFYSMPEFATYQIFTAEVWSNDPPFADLDVSDYFIDSGMPIQMWPGPATDDPDGSIVLYEYDFAYYGHYFTPDASNTTGAPVTSPPFENHEFGQITQQVAMRVTDDGYPPKSTIGAETITIYPLSSDRWARTWGGISRERGMNITNDTNGNIFVCGTFNADVDFDPGPGESIRSSNGRDDAFLSKFNSNGDFEWAVSWGGGHIDSANGVECDDSGNIYITGDFNRICDFDPGPGWEIRDPIWGEDVYVLKLDPNGNFIWVNNFGGDDIIRDVWCLSNDIALDSNNNVFIIGKFRGLTDFDPWGEGDIRYAHGGLWDDDVFVSKFSESGEFLGVITIGSDNCDKGNSITVDNENCFYATGRFLGDIDLDPDPVFEDWHAPEYGYTIFLLKCDQFGNYLWGHSWGGSEGGSISEDIETSELGFVSVTGHLRGDVDLDPGPGVDFKPAIYDDHPETFLSTFDYNGNYLWGHRISGNWTNYGKGISISSNGSIFITGYFTGEVDFDPGTGTDLFSTNPLFEFHRNCFLVKFDRGGSYLGTRIWGSENDDVTYGEKVSVSQLDDVYVTGWFSGTVDFDPSSYWHDYHTSNSGVDAFLNKL